ncbi:hypothetical protein CIPAW_12G058200 [Carya illinoinensis]|uniref:Uncharacterized protein n=1 Tax=Carya illinoinensis TaxID=32201 RepID=A0A8T1NT56_CARIL|nr:hypothetical protein CIPAW_12G058200 [Carya illinoinensis]
MFKIKKERHVSRRQKHVIPKYIYIYYLQYCHLPPSRPTLDFIQLPSSLSLSFSSIIHIANVLSVILILSLSLSVHKIEGLIKGLIYAALGHDNKDEEEEERSRSTWAQVVSGEPDQGEEGSDRLHAYTQNRPSRQENSEFGNEEWDVSGSRLSRRPQKENDEEKNGGWKTVSEKP